MIEPLALCDANEQEKQEMKIQPVKRANISDQVFDQLKRNVIEGKWEQGEKLPSENELAEAFQVSRVTIRNAIHRLVALGLAETKFGEGTFIKELNAGMPMRSMIPMAYLSPRNTLEVLDFRRVLEIETAGIAAEHCTEDDAAALKKQIQVMLDAKGDYLAFSKADLDFHMIIAKITRNSLIIETFGILRDILDACMKDTVENLGVEIGIPFHYRLIEAFEQRDAGKARDIMREHMASTRKEFARVIEIKRNSSRNVKA